MAKVQGEEATLANETMTTTRRRVVKEARKADQADLASGTQGCAYGTAAQIFSILLSNWLPESLIMELPYCINYCRKIISDYGAAILYQLGKLRMPHKVRPNQRAGIRASDVLIPASRVRGG